MAATRIQAISFAYPPLAYPRSIQVARLLKYLKGFNVAVDLVRARYEGFRCDPTIDADAESIPLRVESPPFRLSIFRKAASWLSQRCRIPIVGKTPDPFIAWRRRAKRAAIHLISSMGQPYDALVTFGMPMSVHLVGYDVKKKTGFPWIAHFSDPWSDNPYSDYDRLTHRANLFFEKTVIESADRVVFTNEETRRIVMKKYPSTWSGKSRVLPHAFDPERIQPPQQVGNEKTIRYLGNFYGKRSPGGLFSGIQRLIQTDPKLLDGVRFELIGEIPEHLPERIRHDGLSKHIRCRKPVSYAESLFLMATALGLLVIDAPAETNLFFPSKLADYIGTGRPIAGLTPPGVSRRIIESLGGWTANPDNETEIAEMLGRFIPRILQMPQGNIWGEEAARRPYSASATALRFHEIVENLIRKP